MMKMRYLVWCLVLGVLAGCGDVDRERNRNLRDDANGSPDVRLGAGEYDPDLDFRAYPAHCLEREEVLVEIASHPMHARRTPTGIEFNFDSRLDLEFSRRLREHDWPLRDGYVTTAHPKTLEFALTLTDDVVYGIVGLDRYHPDEESPHDRYEYLWDGIWHADDVPDYSQPFVLRYEYDMLTERHKALTEGPYWLWVGFEFKADVDTHIRVSEVYDVFHVSRNCLDD